MNRLLAISTRFYKSRVTRIVRDTLSILFPIMLLGSFAEVLKFAFLSPSGFIATLFSVTKWLPFVHPLSQLAGVISRCTIDMIGIYGAYGAAYSTVKEYGKKISGRCWGCGYFVLSHDFVPNRQSRSIGI
ncbi:hypothetical protein [Lentilactobacillus parabuchneri]|uniref:hypothetical protein n=1 Tax=Lentilactobacillus parabuchneri TaxID=152331 RepID=UPI001EFC9D16|nr:hypothetical protein [Lentilactobacillus parabuchneri]